MSKWEISKQKTPGLIDLEEKLSSQKKVVDEIMQSCISKIIKQREDQLIKILDIYGYKFENRHDLIQFAKTRCTLVKYEGSPRRIFHIDGYPVCEWWETSRIETDGVNFTCIMGEPPKS